MARFTANFIVSAALSAAAVLMLINLPVAPAAAQSCLPNNNGTELANSVGACPRPGPTGAGSSGASIGDLGNQRFNQMVTNQVLGTVLLGVNEQVNCSDCVSAFGSAGSFSAGIHGREELTNNPPWTFAATCGAAPGLCITTQYADASPTVTPPVDDGSDPTGMLCGR